MINLKTNRHIVVDAHGHLTEIARDPKSPGYAKGSDAPKLKSGWRLATEADLKHAADVEAKRAAKEAAETKAAAESAKKKQDESDAAALAAGGPFKSSK